MNKSFATTAVCFSLLIQIPLNVSAFPVVFDFRSPEIEALDGNNTLAITHEELTITLSTNNGVFNRTASSFGINGAGTNDDPDGIDGGNQISEELWFVFNKPVELLSFTVSQIGKVDSGKIFLNEALDVSFDDSGEIFLHNFFISANESAGIVFKSGNGFSLDSIKALPKITSVTEPSSLFVMLISLTLFFSTRLGERASEFFLYP